MTAEFSEYVPQNFEQQAYPATPKPTGTYGFNPNVPYSNVPTGPQAPIGNVFGQPIVQDMAYQYGQQLANTGKAMVKQEIDKFVPVSKLKYYFAVDTRYVMTKLRLLFFPFTHKVGIFYFLLTTCGICLTELYLGLAAKK